MTALTGYLPAWISPQPITFSATNLHVMSVKHVLILGAFPRGLETSARLG
jgi:hypothetical protein